MFQLENRRQKIKGHFLAFRSATVFSFVLSLQTEGLEQAIFKPAKPVADPNMKVGSDPPLMKKKKLFYGFHGAQP